MVQLQLLTLSWVH